MLQSGVSPPVLEEQLVPVEGGLLCWFEEGGQDEGVLSVERVFSGLEVEVVIFLLSFSACFLGGECESCVCRC